MAHLSVVIPVYKAESCLVELHRRLQQAILPITPDYEIVMVEDCGGDRSWEIIEELHRKDSRVRGVQFSRNFGQHPGITAGLDVCDGDWVVVMDCDLQDRPEEIGKLYAKAKEGYEVVLARRVRRRDPLFKRMVSGTFYLVFSWLADLKWDGTVANFRIMSRKVVDAFRQMREKLRFFGGLVNWMGFRTASVDVEHGERFAGETSYTWRKLFKLGTETILAHSDKPLRLSIRIGFAMAAGAFLFGLVQFLRAFFVGIPVSGWASLIVSLYFIGGLIIANLGMLGIYLGKVFDETKRRPLYIIARRAG